MGAATLPALARPSLDALSDEALCERIAGGDEVAFEILFHRHERGLLSFSRHMLRSLHEAEEVVQHTFISAYNQIGGGDAPRHCKAWLYTVARNRCISILRARPEQVPDDDSEPETEGLDDQVERRSELRALLAEVERLPPDQRAALVLFELEDLSHAEIAKVLAVEPSKVKALVFQARSTLMSYREAREVPCSSIRRQLSILRGGALNRRELRHHLEGCAACTEFRLELRAQRAALGIVLPVVPLAGSGTKLLAALAGGGAATGGTAAAGSSHPQLGLLARVAGQGRRIAAVSAVTAAAAGSYAAIQMGDGQKDGDTAAASPPAQAVADDTEAVGGGASGKLAAGTGEGLPGAPVDGPEAEARPKGERREAERGERESRAGDDADRPGEPGSPDRGPGGTPNSPSAPGNSPPPSSGEGAPGATNVAPPAPDPPRLPDAPAAAPPSPASPPPSRGPREHTNNGNHNGHHGTNNGNHNGHHGTNNGNHNGHRNGGGPGR